MIVVVMEVMDFDDNGRGHWEWQAYGPFGDEELAGIFADRWRESEHRIGEILVVDLNTPADPVVIPEPEPREREQVRERANRLIEARWEPEPVEFNDERGPF